MVLNASSLKATAAGRWGESAGGQTLGGDGPGAARSPGGHGRSAGSRPLGPGQPEGGIAHAFFYQDPNHMHAPSSVDGRSQGYDANGNLVSTLPASTGHKYDAENRRVRVAGAGGTYVARMGYDGDGKRVKRVDTYGTVHYIGPHYERNVGNGQDTTEVITKHYWAQFGPYRRLIAVSRAGLLYYVHGDHLGGTNILSDVYGNEAGAVRYHPFGQTRVQSGLALTNKRFTGQRLDTSIGPSTALAVPTLILTPGSSG